MGVHNNFPAPSWIKLDGISVTKGEEVHIVSDFKTNLKYIYWSLDTPKQLTASNVMLNRSSSRFLIVVNNKGECILVPNEGITVSFDGNSVEAINEHIWGLYEKNEEYGDRFVSVEQNIEGITQTVGQTKEELGEVTEQVSKIEQKTESIDLSVKNLNREYNEDKETQELRENVNKSIIDINSAVGLFKSKITETFKDNEISENENTEIQAQINILEDRKIKVVDQVDKVIALIDTPENQLDTSRLTSQKQVFISAIDNLVTLVNNVISDKVIVPTDVAIITSAFGRASVEINTLKNIIDEIIFLGVGGTISEELARIGIKSDEIVLSVNKIEENNQNNIKEVDKKYSEILLTPDGIVNRVGKIETKTDSNSNRLTSAESEIKQLSNQISFTVTEGEVKSIIEQSPDEIRYGFNGISDYVVINRNGLDVRRGRIACDSITASSSNPILRLFEGNGLFCAIDATAYMNEGVGSSIRLKRDNNNYVRVGHENFGIHYGGTQRFSFYSGNASEYIRTPNGTIGFSRNGINYDGRDVSFAGHTHGWGDITGKPSSFTPSYHNHSGDVLKPDTLVCRAFGNGSSTIMHNSLDGNGKNLGWSGSKFNQVSANVIWGDAGSVSDMKFKENIHYINSPKTTTHNTTTGVTKINDKDMLNTLKLNKKSNVNLGITPNDLYNFVKNDLKLCEYNYTKEFLCSNIDNFENKLGFIAQDLVNKKVGNLIVGEHEGDLAYNLNNYVSVIAGALQVEIKKGEERDKEIEIIKSENTSLKQELSEIKSMLDELLQNK